MCNCSGECCVCALGGGGCLAGNGDDDFIPAKKEKIIERLDNNEYERYREYMIKYLKEKYEYDYIENKEKQENSSEFKKLAEHIHEAFMINHEILKEIENYRSQKQPTKLESEDKSMLHKITVTKTEEKVLEEYYVMRGIKKQYDGLGNEKKIVCREREVLQYPDLGTIAQFLNECGADFVSVEHNYRFEPDLPFC